MHYSSSLWPSGRSSLGFILLGVLTSNLTLTAWVHPTSLGSNLTLLLSNIVVLRLEQLMLPTNNLPVILS